jgi:hypothetical protein
MEVLISGLKVAPPSFTLLFSLSLLTCRLLFSLLFSLTPHVQAEREGLYAKVGLESPPDAAAVATGGAYCLVPSCIVPIIFSIELST